MDRPLGKASAVALALLLAGPAARASDGRIKVSESTLNKLTTALGTQTLRSTLFEVDLGLFTVSCVAKAFIKKITFSIRAQEIAVHAAVDGEVCGVDIPGLSADTFLGVSFNSATQQLLFTLSPGGLRVHKKFGPIDPSVTIEMSNLLLPSIPIDSARFPVETARGRRDFTLSGRGVVLSVQDGFIELSGDVLLR